MTKEEAQQRIQSHLDEIDYIVLDFPELFSLVESFWIGDDNDKKASTAKQ